MKNKILFICVLAAALFVWSCNEKSPVAPEFANQNETLDKKVPVGTVTSILGLNKTTDVGFPPLDSYDSPEGITIDKSGIMYISNTIGWDQSTNQILRVNLDGTSYVYATLPGSGHSRGLATDRKGIVYVAFATKNQITNGVYRIGQDRNPERLEGSENIGSPNALTFDKKGNLYCTSSLYEVTVYGGAIWRFGKEQTFERWFMNTCLDGGPHPVAGELVGANGIVFYPPNKLYVANTAQNSVSRILIGRRGTAASIELVKQDDLLLNSIDGIAVDVHENIYGAMPGSTLGFIGAPQVPPLLMLNPNTGIVTPIITSDGASDFNTPTSLVFGTGGQWNRKSVFIANAALQYGQPHDVWANPGVVEVYVGIPGKPGK